MKAANKSRLLCFELFSCFTFFFAISALPHLTKAVSTIAQEAGERVLIATNDPGHLVRRKSGLHQINQVFKAAAYQRAKAYKVTCGTNVFCRVSSAYCIGTLDENGAIVSRCPETEHIAKRCDDLGYKARIQTTEGIEIEDGKWCCRPEHRNEGCKHVFRTCSGTTTCRSRYCIAVESKGAKAICPTEITGKVHDGQCNAIARGTTKWLEEGKWCCKSPQKCDTTIRRCGTNSQCPSPFCLTDATKTTTCPSAAFSGRTHCETLPRGKTKNLGGGTWCCNADSCDTDVRSCGGGPCTVKICIGIRSPDGATIQTTCPHARVLIEDCLNLSPGEEIAFNGNSVCCNANSCLGKYRRCGSDKVCAASFCITRRRQGSMKQETVCPTAAEIEKNANNCQSLPDGGEFRIDPDTYCCKASNCPMSDTLSAPRASAKATNSTFTRFSDEPPPSHNSNASVSTISTNASTTATQYTTTHSSEKTGGGSLYMVYPIIIALLIVACVGGSVICYFIGKRKDKQTKPRYPAVWKDPIESIQTTDQGLTAEKGAMPRLKNAPVTTQNYNEVMKQKRVIDYKPPFSVPSQSIDTDHATIHLTETCDSVDQTRDSLAKPY